MNKRKIVLLASALMMVAVLAVGGTLAYFTDTDAQVNTFTVGDITIDLFEDFNSDELQLIPAVGTRDPETGVSEFKNAIEKEVYVKNTDETQPAYIRVHIAIPDLSTVKGEKISAISLTCYDKTTVDGMWIWGTTLNANYPSRDGGDWNRYSNITINDVPYKVFVLTYESPVAAQDVTVDAIKTVYMDPKVTQDDIKMWDTTYGEDVWAKVYVVAEAVQATGFEDAITALNTAFGVPGEYTVDFAAESEGDTFVERNSLEGK